MNSLRVPVQVRRCNEHNKCGNHGGQCDDDFIAKACKKVEMRKDLVLQSKCLCHSRKNGPNMYVFPASMAR